MSTTASAAGSANGEEADDEPGPEQGDVTPSEMDDSVPVFGSQESRSVVAASVHSDGAWAAEAVEPAAAAVE
eukprot:12014658-Heterocapsa_arctica.AAC.1